jgi:hypothetical protein
VIAMAMATKRPMATDGDNTGNGYGKEASGQAMVAGDGDGAKDMATHATTGERGMMVAMGHGLYVSFCVCGVTTKNKVGPKKVMVPWSIDRARLATAKLAQVAQSNKQQNAGVARARARVRARARARARGRARARARARDRRGRGIGKGEG